MIHDFCANLECPNTAEHGQMVVLRSADRHMVNSGKRGMTLYLCVPCASATALALAEPTELMRLPEPDFKP